MTIEQLEYLNLPRLSSIDTNREGDATIDSQVLVQSPGMSVIQESNGNDPSIIRVKWPTGPDEVYTNHIANPAIWAEMLKIWPGRPAENQDQSHNTSPAATYQGRKGKGELADSPRVVVNQDTGKLKQAYQTGKRPMKS